MNVVQKYSGQSIDSIKSIRALADFIANNRAEGDGLVIVVSAMETTNERLRALAQQAGANVPEKEMDVMMATGEQQTAALMSIALNNAGISATSVTGYVSEIVANDIYMNARLKEFNTANIEEIINDGNVAVVAGGDVTAVAIAAHLDWPCEIYGDAQCLYTADPAVYADAKQITDIAYEEVMELAHLGNRILEKRSVELAKKYDVKLFFGKAMEEDKSKGTYIMNNQNLLVEDMPITGMSIQEDITIFTLRNVTNDGKAVAEAFRILGEMGINVDMISQQSTGPDTCSVSFSCTAAQGAQLKEQISANDAFAGVTIDCEDGLAIISLVGVGMATHSGVASQVFSVLAANDVRYYHITTSEISISVTVDMDNKVKAAIALCQTFDL